MGRTPCCDKANVKKGPWSPEEDTKLKEFIENYGTGGNWIALPHKAGLKRCGKSCRLRWLNYLRPNLKHGEFSGEEDRIICTLYLSIGSRWSIIAAQLPGRTDNDIKNYWNTKLKKRLFGIPQVQRKPHLDQQLLFSSPLDHNNPTAVLSSSSSANFYPSASPLHLDHAGFSSISSDITPLYQSGSILSFHSGQSCNSSDGSSTHISYGKEKNYDFGGDESYLYSGMEENHKLHLGDKNGIWKEEFPLEYGN